MRFINALLIAVAIDATSAASQKKPAKRRGAARASSLVALGAPATPAYHQDPCKMICVLPGMCGMGESACITRADKSQTCHDLFLRPDWSVCSSGSPDCPDVRPLFCKEAEVIFESHMSPGTVSEAAPSGPRNEASPMFLKGRRGIQNLGNTCYLAAALQLLVHSRHIREALLSYVPPALHAGTPPLVPAPIAMAQAVRLVVEAEWRSLRATSALPINVTPVLRILTQVNPDFAAGKMQDSAEGLVMILDLLKEQIPAMRDLLATTLRGTRSCPVCHGSRIKDDVVDQISVPVPEQLSHSFGLNEAFRKYFETEFFDEMECDGGTCVEGQRYPAIVRKTFAATAQILFITLNRFEFDMETLERRRLNTRVKFPAELDMSELPGGAGTYRLVGVTHHDPLPELAELGAVSTAESGHYYSDFLHPDDGAYYRADDSVVYPLPGLPELASNTAYILMYERI